MGTAALRQYDDVGYGEYSPDQDALEGTGLMSSVPDELFRRRMAARALDSAEEKIRSLEDLLRLDYSEAAKAARAHLAYILMDFLDRDDLGLEFRKLRDEAIVRGKMALADKLRDYSQRPSRKGVKQGQPTPRPAIPKRRDDRPHDSGKD